MECRCGYNLSSDNTIVNPSTLFKVDSDGMIHLNGIMKCPNCQLEYSAIIEMPYEKNKECLKKYAYDKFGFKISDEQLDEIINTTEEEIKHHKDLFEKEQDIYNYTDKYKDEVWKIVIYE